MRGCARLAGKAMPPSSGTAARPGGRLAAVRPSVEQGGSWEHRHVVSGDGFTTCDSAKGCEGFCSGPVGLGRVLRQGGAPSLLHLPVLPGEPGPMTVSVCPHHIPVVKESAVWLATHEDWPGGDPAGQRLPASPRQTTPALLRLRPGDVPV